MMRFSFIGPGLSLLLAGCASGIEYANTRDAALDRLPSPACVRQVLSSVKGATLLPQQAGDRQQGPKQPDSIYYFGFRYPLPRGGWSIFTASIGEKDGKAFYALRWPSSPKGPEYDSSVRGYAQIIEADIAALCETPELPGRVKETRGGSFDFAIWSK